jgi:hypothetical protein
MFGASMDLGQSIFESMPHASGFSAFLDFIIERGPFVAGVASIIFILMDVVIMRWRRGRPVPEKANHVLELLSSFGLMLGIVLVTLFGLYSLHNKWMPKPPEIAWQEKIADTLQRCLTRLDALPFEARERLEQRLLDRYESPKFHCLAFALQNAGSADLSLRSDASAAERYRAEMRLADRLLEIPKVSDILGRAFSISKENFLGYGYSLPSDNSEPRAREYLVKNQCSMSSKPGGPCALANSASTQVFTWIFSPGVVRATETIGAILSRNQPEENREAFTDLLKQIDEGRLAKSPPLLIRFSKFPITGYFGTIGRPDSTYVFFSNLDEMWTRSIAASETISGREPDTSAGGTQGVRIFVWVYYPTSADDAQAATWKNIFKLLKSTVRVDPDIARLARE